MSKIFMHKTSFDISAGRVESIGTPKREIAVSDLFFEVDELIALPLQTLNRKGYLTACSCQGHPFDPVFFHLSEDGQPLPFVAEGLSLCESYVTFLEPYDLPSLPEGFTLEKTAKSVRIFKHYEKNGDYEETLYAVIDAMKELARWAKSLPEKA